MVLERAEFAAARGATRARPAGRRRHHLRRLPHHRPRPGGRRAVPGDRQGACATPGWTPADIGHVNCHATSTVVGDVGEAAAIRKALGDHAGAHRAEVGARAPGRRGRRGREHHHGAVDPGRRHPGHAATWRTSTPGSSWTWWPASRARWTLDRGGLRLVRLRRAQRRPGVHRGLTSTSVRLRRSQPSGGEAVGSQDASGQASCWGEALAGEASSFQPSSSRISGNTTLQRMQPPAAPPARLRRPARW